ncbi:MAG: c-type cytochrome [Acidimicrobiales bacterium]
MAANLPKGPVAPSGPSSVARSTPKPLAPYVQAAKRRQRIPVWAFPVVLILPLWAFLYAGTLEPPPARTLTLAQAGAGLYGGAAGCAACHGASGAGSAVFPQLSEGAVIGTFPDPVEQVRWIILGSAGGAEVYARAGKQVGGGMPAFGDTLSLTEIVEVVLHERKTLSSHPVEEDAELWAGLRALPEEFADLDYTEEEIELILEEIAAQESVEIPEPAA